MTLHHVDAGLTSVLRTFTATGNGNPLGLDLQLEGTTIIGEPVTYIAVGQ